MRWTGLGRNGKTRSLRMEAEGNQPKARIKRSKGKPPSSSLAPRNTAGQIPPPPQSVSQASTLSPAKPPLITTNTRSLPAPADDRPPKYGPTRKILNAYEQTPSGRASHVGSNDFDVDKRVKESSRVDCDDDASKTSQGSNNTSSKLNATYNRFKGYLPRKKHGTCEKQQKSLTKQHDHRPGIKKSKNANIPLSRKVSFSSVGDRAEPPVTLQDVDAVAGEPPKDTSVQKSVDKNATANVPSTNEDMHQSQTLSTKALFNKTPARCISMKKIDGVTQVFNLPWMDSSSEGKLCGLYSGPVIIQPHGEGHLVLEGEGVSKQGRWIDGELVTSLMDDGEQMSKECASSFESRSKYKRKSSTESRRYSLSSSVVSDFSNVISDYSNLIPECSGLTDPDSCSVKSPLHQKESCAGSKRKYRLGEIARSPRDMVIHRSNDAATNSASMLKKHDHAFLKRSDGLWTCAMIADRAFQPKHGPSARSHWRTEGEISHNKDLEESMLFVINDDGATKIVKKRYWGKFIRRIRNYNNEDEECGTDGISPSLKILNESM